MSRSSKKGPYVYDRLLKKIRDIKPEDRKVIKTWARSSVISPEMIGFTFGVHNGKDFINVIVKEEMVGHKFGEFAPTRKFIKHGGKMQKQQEMAAQQAEADKKAAAK
jgi:small subunit ribosomal protein S19